MGEKKCPLPRISEEPLPEPELLARCTGSAHLRLSRSGGFLPPGPALHAWAGAVVKASAGLLRALHLSDRGGLLTGHHGVNAQGQGLCNLHGSDEETGSEV